MIPPGAEHFHAEIQGVPFFVIGALYAGPVEEGQKALQPLRSFGQPLFDASGVMPFVTAQKVFDEEYPNGLHYYWKSINLSRLDDEAIDRIVAHSRLQPSPLSTTDIWHVGGAVKRVGAGESAFFGRQASFLLNPEANWVDANDDQANLQWVRAARILNSG